MEKFLLHEHVYANPPYNITDIKKLIKVVTENKYIFKGVLILPDWDEVKELLRTLKSERAFDGTTKLTKHYQIRLQTIREYVRSECIVPFKVDTKDNLADLLTKSKVTGGNDSFKRLRDLMFIGGRQEMMENLLKDGFRHATRYPSFQIWKNKATNVRAEELAEIPEVFTSERNIAYTVMDNYHFKEAEPTVSYSPGTANDFISG